jgi:serine/threonine-protein kinase
MLVVLPFENLGAPEDDYFADGITEEITSRLAALQGLGVISRTSAFQYKGAGKTIKEIGQELGVGYVLEGTVRWDSSPAGESHVRVTPQLIRVSDDTHLWSERYDHELQNIFAVQSKIAERVIEQLDVTLLGSERDVLLDRPTENMDAYQAYLRGLDHMNQPGMPEENARAAVQMFERAVEIDPDFALAYVWLSQVLSNMYHSYYDRTDACLAKAKAAVERALKLQPDLPEAHLVLGLYHYWGHRDYDEALKELAIAEKDLPNDVGILVATGAIHRRLGRFEMAREKMERAFELSPQNAELAVEVAFTCAPLRAYDDAVRYCDRAIFIRPDYILAYVIKVLHIIQGFGDLERSRDVLEEMPVGNASQRSAGTVMWVMQLAYERDYERLLGLLASIPVEYMDISDFVFSRSLIAGMVYHAMGQADSAGVHFNSAQVVLESKVAEDPEDHRVRSLLGMAYAGQGRKEDAIREGRRAVALCPVSKDAIVGPDRLEELAEILVAVGEYDAALDEIERLLTMPGGITIHSLRLDPSWDAVRTHPRFQRLLKAYSEAG